MVGSTIPGTNFNVTSEELDIYVDPFDAYLGKRVQKTVYAYGSGSWQLEKEILFVYDGWHVIEEITLVDSTETSRYFVWGLDASQSLQGAGGIGGLLAMVDNGTTYHFFYDANGNVSQLVNAANGEIAAHYEFDPFGNTVYQSGSMADDNPFRHATQYFDEETGLIAYIFRYYDPELGRWINRDPIEELGFKNSVHELKAWINKNPPGGNDRGNLYVFILNNGLLFIDFLGLDNVTIYWYSNDDANFEAAALSKEKELKDGGDTVNVQSYSGRVSPNADVVYMYSHGNESGPNGYGQGAGDMAINGLAKVPAEYADFTNVKKAIRFMGCNLGHDYESTTAGNQSFAQYLAAYLAAQGKTADVYASETGSQVQITSPSGKYSASELRALLSGPKNKWMQAIKCGDLKVEYVSDKGSYTKF